MYKEDIGWFWALNLDEEVKQSEGFWYSQGRFQLVVRTEQNKTKS